MNKKRLISTFLMVCLVCVFLVGCGTKKPSGTYADNLGFSTLEFKGNEVTMISLGGDSKGKFTIDKDNKISVDYENGNKDTFEYDPETDTISFAGGVMVFTKMEK